MTHARLLLVAFALAHLLVPPRAGAQRIVADSLLQSGRAAFDAGDFARAAEILEGAVAADSSHSRAFHWLGNAYLKQVSDAPLGKPLLGHKARDAWARAAALDPKDILSRQYLASWYVSAPGFLGGDADRAMALAKEISDIDAYRGAVVRGGLANRAGDADGAAAAYAAAMRLPGDSTGTALERWLKVVERRRDRAAAVAEVRAAMQLRPDDERIKSALDRLTAGSP